MVCDGPTCKGKETLTFVGRNWASSEGQVIIFTGLLHPTFFRKRGVCLFWVCAFNLRDAEALMTVQQGIMCI